MFLPSACPRGILYLRVELRHLHPEERQIVFARPIQPGGSPHSLAASSMKALYNYSRGSTLWAFAWTRLAFAVSARFSLPRGAKLPPASARCSPNECLLALSFCAR